MLLRQDAEAKVRYDQMRREIAGLPGVIEVGVGSSVPLKGSSTRFAVKAEGRALPPGEPAVRPDFRTASPEYFNASGIPIINGRAFAATDGGGAGKVVIINQTLADKLFPGEDPIGKRIAWSDDILKFTPISGDWRTIIGVSGNTQDGGQAAPPRAVMFMPFVQELAMGGVLVVRADSNVAGLASATTRIVRRLAPGAPIQGVLTVRQIKAESVAPQRLNAALVSSFGILAVVIAAVGIAGVLAFSVSARTNEIGIRMSLGADRGRVQRMILREGAVLLVIGLALGVTGAYFAGGVIRGFLFGVAPHDPVTFAGVAAMMAAIGLAACWVPALRASRIDPAITMRA
jgi:predicted permease